jgi:hypothetical protein
MVDFVIKEPSFSDSPERYFKLPFLACEILTTDNEFMRLMVFEEN